MALERSSGTYMDDAQSLQALVACMEDREREEYRSYGALALEAVFPQRRMVVYTLRNAEAVDIEMLLFRDLEVTRVEGPAADVESGAYKLRVTTVPKRYNRRDLFLHIPQNFTLKWKGKQASSSGVQFVPHYAVLIKTRSKEIHQIEGHTYCVTLNKFWERFPHLKNIRY